jgi:hypothetical protein
MCFGSSRDVDDYYDDKRYGPRHHQHNQDPRGAARQDAEYRRQLDKQRRKKRSRRNGVIAATAATSVG